MSSWWSMCQSLSICERNSVYNWSTPLNNRLLFRWCSLFRWKYAQLIQKLPALVKVKYTALFVTTREKTYLKPVNPTHNSTPHNLYDTQQYLTTHTEASTKFFHSSLQKFQLNTVIISPSSEIHKMPISNLHVVTFIVSLCMAASPYRNSAFAGTSR